MAAQAASKAKSRRDQMKWPCPDSAMPGLPPWHVASPRQGCMDGYTGAPRVANCRAWRTVARGELSHGCFEHKRIQGRLEDHSVDRSLRADRAWLGRGEAHIARVSPRRTLTGANARRAHHDSPGVNALQLLPRRAFRSRRNQRRTFACDLRGLRDRDVGPLQFYTPKPRLTKRSQLHVQVGGTAYDAHYHRTFAIDAVVDRLGGRDT